SGSTLTVTNAIDTTVAHPAGANITLLADSMNLNAAVNGGTGGIGTLNVGTAKPAIDLGPNPSSGKLGLAQGDLNHITASILRIGSGSGINSDITVTAPITDVRTGWSTLSLSSNNGVSGNISQHSGASLTVTNLKVVSDQDVTLTDSGSTVTQVAGFASGNFSFVNSTSLTVGDVDPALGHPGLQSGFGGTVSATALGTGSLLTVSNAIDTTTFGHSGDIILSADDMAINAALK